MNRTIAFVTLAFLVALGIIGFVVLILMSPEKSDQFVSFFLLIMGNITVAAGTLWNLGRTEKKLDIVKRQTNGALSGALERNDQQALELRDKEVENRLLKELIKQTRINADNVGQ